MLHCVRCRELAASDGRAAAKDRGTGVKRMRLKELCRGWLEVPARWRDVGVQGLAADSRAVRPGDLFVAVPGEVTDGHLYIDAAVDAGAVAVVGEQNASQRSRRHLGVVPYLRVQSAKWALGQLAAAFHGHPSQELAATAVTGTKGKTTTCWILDAILRRSGAVTGLFGTVENRIGDRVFPATSTTPSCLDLQRWLGELVGEGGTHAVLEVSSHAIQQQRLGPTSLACAVFTNIAPEHLDYHKTFESYLAVKASLFNALDAAAFAVLPREEKAAEVIAERTPARIVWYGTDLQDGVERLRMHRQGTEFVWKGHPVRTRLWGDHNLLNALAAMTAAESLGVPPPLVAEAMAEAVAPPGRLEPVCRGGPFQVVVDYAHTDGSLEAVLKALRPLTPGRLITVFGCGGDRDRFKRPRMGRVAETYSDHVIVTSDNPRSEPPKRILAEIASGLARPGDAVLVEDRREAIGLAIRMAREGDTVLIAGKGHEVYQQFADGTVPFDDRKVAREFVEEMLSGCLA
jgi:UDP-N-acetylmuramoyl-L-alanyl-D-glutamate--2,6-diaminopimelate ligase